MATIRTFQQHLLSADLWSIDGNWSPFGAPENGDGVLDGAASWDDIPTLALSTLTLGADLNIGASLSVASLSVSAGTTTVNAGGTLAVGALSTASSATIFDAAGAGALITVGGTTDPGEAYVVAPGAKVVLSVPPASGTMFEISGFNVLDPGQAFTGLIPIVALANPGTADPSTGITTIDSLFVNAPNFRSPSYGDAIELPGTSVASVTKAGTLGLNVVTSAGTYDFTEFETINLPASGSQVAFVATHDDATGLEQITFGNTTDFVANQAQVGGPFNGFNLWSDPLNWDPGLPFQRMESGTLSSRARSNQ